MREFTEQMQADHVEALRISAVETAKAQTKTVKLREVLAKIGGFANSWANQYSASPFREHIITKNVVEKFETIEQTCLAALEEPEPPTGPVSHVIVDGRIYTGNIIEPRNSENDLDDWVTIEVVDIDQTAGRMEVSGPPAGFIKS